MIDTHCHINDELYKDNAEEYIISALEGDVDKFFDIGFDLASSSVAIMHARKSEAIKCAIGIHPSEVKKMQVDDLTKLTKMIDKKYVKAIGEIGLDFYWDKDEKIRDQQKKIFIEQIDLANKFDLPVIIHSREATQETFNILKNHPVNRGGIIHCYPGSVEMMNEFIKINFLIGVGGVVTFKNARQLVEVVKAVPLDKFVLETDAPYLAPTPYRGKANHSKYLPLIAEKIATVKNIDVKTIIDASDNNFLKLIGEW